MTEKPLPDARARLRHIVERLEQPEPEPVAPPPEDAPPHIVEMVTRRTQMQKLIASVHLTAAEEELDRIGKERDLPAPRARAVPGSRREGLLSRARAMLSAAEAT